MKKELRIAILSPNKNAYSETFIQAQKTRLKGRIFYYFDGFVPTKLEGEGSIIIKYAGLKRKLGFFNGDIKSQSLIKSFKKNKIDVVLAQYGPTGQAVAKVCEVLNMPLVIHFHGYDATVTTVIERHKNYKDAFRIAKHVISVSNVMYNKLLQLGCPKAKLKYNVYGANPEFFDVNPKFSEKQLIAIGRFTNKKAPYYTILAFKEVLKSHPNAKLLMAGQGELMETCENLVKLFGLQNNIRFLGVVTHKDIMSYYSNAMGFVQHSITAKNGDMEGTPLAVLEASAAGLPVVSTYHAGISDVIIHEETGLLSEEHDVDSMAQHMKLILDNPDFAKKLGASGRERIKEKFNMERHIYELQKIISSFKEGYN